VLRQALRLNGADCRSTIATMDGLLPGNFRFLRPGRHHALSIVVFAGMPADAGAELTGKSITPAPAPAEAATGELRGA